MEPDRARPPRRRAAATDGGRQNREGEHIMTLQDARELAATLDGKAAGHLIRAEDWNALVSVLAAYGNSLDALSTDLAVLQSAVDTLETNTEAAISALDARIDPLESLPALVQKLDAETAPLRQNYLLKVSTAQEHYLVGQAAELVFTATTLDGKPCPTPSPGSTWSPPGGGCAPRPASSCARMPRRTRSPCSSTTPARSACSCARSSPRG
jgi:hypothetical protein